MTPRVEQRGYGAADGETDAFDACERDMARVVGGRAVED